MNTITGKSALVLGGVGGIGKSIVSHLLSSGLTRLGVIDIVDDAKANEALSDLLSQYKGIKFVNSKCLIEDEPALRVAMTRIAKDLNGLDLVINSVGILNELDPKKTIMINYVSEDKAKLIFSSKGHTFHEF